jgi:hypothetical protein
MYAIIGLAFWANHVGKQAMPRFGTAAAIQDMASQTAPELTRHAALQQTPTFLTKQTGHAAASRQVGLANQHKQPTR